MHLHVISPTLKKLQPPDMFSGLLSMSECVSEVKKMLSDFFLFYFWNIKQKMTKKSCLCFQLKKDEAQMYSVTLEEEVPVRNLKPAVVKVYDYYQTSEFVCLFFNREVSVALYALMCLCFSGDEAVTEYTSYCAESM